MRLSHVRYVVVLSIMGWMCFLSPCALAGISLTPVEDCGAMNSDMPKPAEGRANPVLVAGAKITPSFMCARVAKTMDPQNVALLAVALSPKKAAAITRRLDVDFVAEVTKYLDPVKSIPIINHCPDDLIAHVVKTLLNQGEAAIAGRIADNLDARKMVAVSEDLSIDEYIKVGCHMKHKPLIARVLAAKSDEILIELVEECASKGYYRLIAQVVQEMDAQRVMKLLDRLSMNHEERSQFIAFLAPDLNPDKSAKILLLCPDETVTRVVSLMINQDHAKAAGLLAGTLPKQKLVSISKQLNPKDIIQVGYHMTQKKLIAEVLSEYDDEELIRMFKETVRLGYEDLIPPVIAEMEPDRINNIVAGLTGDDITHLVSELKIPGLNQEK